MPNLLNETTTPDNLTLLADAVVDALAAGEFSQAFAPQRFTTIKEAVEKMTGDVKVAVLMEAIRESGLARGSDQEEDDVALIVLRKLQPQETAQDVTDAMLAVARELRKYLKKTPLATFLSGDLNCRLTDTAIHVPYSPLHLETYRTVLCPMTLTFRVFN